MLHNLFMIWCKFSVVWFRFSLRIIDFIGITNKRIMGVFSVLFTIPVVFGFAEPYLPEWALIIATVLIVVITIISSLVVLSVIGFGNLAEDSDRAFILGEDWESHYALKPKILYGIKPVKAWSDESSDGDLSHEEVRHLKRVRKCSFIIAVVTGVACQIGSTLGVWGSEMTVFHPPYTFANMFSILLAFACMEALITGLLLVGVGAYESKQEELSDEEIPETE